MNAMLNTLRRMFRPASRPSARRGVALRLESLEERCVPSQANMTQITDASSFPYSAVVQVESIFPHTPQGYFTEGTGALIDPTHVLTAGHVLYDPSLGGWATSVYVFAGMTSQDQYVAAATASGERVFTNFINDVNTQWSVWHTVNHNPGDGDIGLVTLNAPIGEQVGAYYFGYQDLNSFAGQTLNTIGYPAGGDQDPTSWDNGWNQWAQSGTIDGSTNFFPGIGVTAPFAAFYYSENSAAGTYTEGGQSGSPVFAVTSSGQHIIYGVVESGDGVTGYAERITSTVFNVWETAMQQDESGSGGSDSRQDEALISNPILLKTQTTLQASASTAGYGQSVTFTAYVSSPGLATPTTGTVTFYDGATALGTVQLKATSSARASASFTTSTLSTPTLSIGSHSITAVYSGGGDFESSTSGAVKVSVTGGETTTYLLGPTGAVTAGQPVTLGAYIFGVWGGAYPTGTVTFYDGDKVLGTTRLSPYLAVLPAGYASLTTSALGIGSHTITADYSGDGNYQSGASDPLNVVVNPAAPPPPNLGLVAGLLTHSAEYYGDFVTAAYKKYLGRTPGAAEVAGWVTAMQNGLTDERVEAAFIGSPEYIADHGGAGAGWITGLYQDLLGRTPSQAEVNGWLQALGLGETPEQVAYGFAASPEREAIVVQDDYMTYLGRSASQAEVGSWVAAFEGGARNEDVAAGFVGSTEYYDSHGDTPTPWLDSAYEAILGRQPDAAEVNLWLPLL